MNNSIQQEGRLRWMVKCLMAHEKYVDERLKDAQNDGWIIAGDIMLKENTNGDGAIFFHIPMKKATTPYPPYLHDLIPKEQKEGEDWVPDFTKIREFDFNKLAPKPDIFQSLATAFGYKTFEDMDTRECSIAEWMFKELSGVTKTGATTIENTTP